MQSPPLRRGKPSHPALEFSSTPTSSLLPHVRHALPSRRLISPLPRHYIAFTPLLPHFRHLKPSQHRHFCLTFAMPCRHFAFALPSLSLYIVLLRLRVTFTTLLRRFLLYVNVTILALPWVKRTIVTFTKVRRLSQHNATPHTI